MGMIHARKMSKKQNLKTKNAGEKSPREWARIPSHPLALRVRKLHFDSHNNGDSYGALGDSVRRPFFLASRLGLEFLLPALTPLDEFRSGRGPCGCVHQHALHGDAD
jgi:hypothetical protein